jgi:outer membrane immunogenic protein
MLMPVPKRLFAIALAAIALASGAATAADVTPYASPATVRDTFWQGPYVGANLGYQWGLATNAVANKPSGAAGGLQGGYSWQLGSFVFGGETDLQFSDADNQFAGWKFANPWFGTLRVRAGLAAHNMLFYGTVGLAYGTMTAKNLATGVSEARTSTGFAGGLGAEVALMGNWTARAEYLYVDLSDRSFVLTGAQNGLGSSVLRFGVNYRF